MSLHEDLEDYQSRSSKLIDQSPQMDEQNTKRKVIEPLIELLGWDIISSDVELEYSVQMGSGTKKVDYALILEDTPVVFVEAKGCDTTLDDSHGNQLRSYMRQVGVDWGLISNGRQFKIFRRDYSSRRPNEITLADFYIDDIVEYRHTLQALSKEAIVSGESGQIAEKIEKVQTAVQILQKEKESIAEKVTRVVSNEVGKSVSQLVEDDAKSFVDDLISSLEEQAHQRNVTDQTQEPTGAPGSEYAIRLMDNRSLVHQVSEKTQAKTMAALVEYLIRERELLKEIDLPYVPGTGRGTRALINDEPVHTDGGEMRQFEPIDGGYYVYTSLSADDKIKYLSELPEKVGLTCEYVGNW